MQVCADMRDEKTRQQECRALFKAAEELGLDGGIIVTMDEEDEIEKNGKIIRIVPAWKYFLNLKFKIRGYPLRWPNVIMDMNMNIFGSHPIV